MHIREIVEALVKHKGINADILIFADLVKSVEQSLVYHRGGSIVAVGSRPLHWKLAD